MRAPNDRIAVDHQLGSLLALIVMSAREIEDIKEKAAAHEQFHTRTAYLEIDSSNKGYIDAECLLEYSKRQAIAVDLKMCRLFCCKLIPEVTLTPSRFIRYLTPKKDRVLGQKLLLRVQRHNRQLSEVLRTILKTMIEKSILSCYAAEELRGNICRSSQLSHLDLVEFLKSVLRDEETTYSFVMQAVGDYYDITRSDFRLLSLMVSSRNELRHFNEIDVKELLYPISDGDTEDHAATKASGFHQTVSQAWKTNTKMLPPQTQTGMNFNMTGTNQNFKTSANFLNAQFPKALRRFDQQRSVEFNPSELKEAPNKFPIPTFKTNQGARLSGNNEPQIPLYLHLEPQQNEGFSFLDKFKYVDQDASGKQFVYDNKQRNSNKMMNASNNSNTDESNSVFEQY